MEGVLRVGVVRKNRLDRTGGSHGHGGLFNDNFESPADFRDSPCTGLDIFQIGGAALSDSIRLCWRVNRDENEVGTSDVRVDVGREEKILAAAS